MEPLRYFGSSNQYVDFAIRGEGEFLGVGVDYAKHPSGVGCFVVRFVAHGAANPLEFKHLSYREPAQFVIPSGTMPELFEGFRLDKVAFGVFEPAVQKRELDFFATKYGVWSLLTNWIADQAMLEGFTVVVDLEKEIKSLLIARPSNVDEVTCVLRFPDLTSPEYRASLKPVVKPEPEEDEDDNGDEPPPTKGWTN